MPRRPSRRTFLFGLGSAGAGLMALRCSVPSWLAARSVRRLHELSDEARALVRRCFDDVDARRVWDLHVHAVGLGAGGTGCWVNPDMRSYWNPLERLRFDVYLSASGVTDPERADQQFLERLLTLHRAANPVGRLALFAFDYHVAEDGTEVPALTPFHVPDGYVLGVAAANRDVVPVVSVHPYRRDALERLDAAAERGAVAVKWLPNAMGIDPASRRCLPFYARLAELDLPLITHAGLEKAVHAEEHQRLGNPLLLRHPLDAGVRVVAAHCASLGESEDLDAGGGRAPSFDLFMRLMGERQYEGRLFGEISALTLVNRSREPLRELLAAPELHPRLLNGSDYPLPAIDPILSTRVLVRRGFLASDDRRLANEVFEANPLLFDYVVKRLLRVESGGREHRFAPVVFESARLFG